MHQHRSVFAVLAALALTVPAAAMAAGDVQTAWRQHELKFHYFGFTSDYSCDGAKTKIKQLLEHLGAKDIEVRRRGCIQGPGQVEPFVNLDLKFSTLAETGSDAVDAVPAQWQPVAMGYNRPRNFQFGDCELIEQFRDQVLPAFSHRIIDQSLSCVPGQSRQWSLTVEVPRLVAEPLADNGR